VLDWPTRSDAASHKRLALVRQLLATRRHEIVPRLAGAVFGEAHAAEDGWLIANWRMGDGAMLRLDANLSSREISHKASEAPGTSIWGGAIGATAPPWSVFWRLEPR
jgi:maltooligosyltrehalose trehalohydrolase